VVGFGTKGDATTVVDFLTTGTTCKKIVDLGGTLKAIREPRVIRAVDIEIGGGGSKVVVVHKFTEEMIG
jgi:hypothetical protein